MNANSLVKIMIVDDSSVMRHVLKDFVQQQQNMEVCAVAENGEQALKVLKSSSPDVIILDIEMPIMNGLQFLRHAKLKSRAKVVILSSVAGIASEKANTALQLGADAIVSKPSGAVSHCIEGDYARQLLDSIQLLLNREY